MCLFSSFPFNAIWGPPNEVARIFINTACGWNMGPDDIQGIVRRNDVFSRCISLREGYHPDKNAVLPERAFDEPVTNKYGKTSVWKRDEWEDAKKKYYINVLGLSERGFPKREDLKTLGLEFVIPVLEAVGVLG
jgi:aldehyde:ferredoxin oxidoreductase